METFATKQVKGDSLKGETGEVTVKTEPGRSRLDIMTRIKHATETMGTLNRVEVTPSMAHNMLLHNTENRPLRKHKVALLAEKMNKGKWVFNGNQLRFSTEMKLLDGQHSLNAVILSDKPQLFNIVCGLLPKAYETIDNGTLRSAGDFLSSRGYKNVNVLAGGIRAYLYYINHNQVGARVNPSGRIDVQMISAWTERRDMKLMVEAVDVAVNYYHPRQDFIAQTTWTFLHFLFSKLDRDKASEFLTFLATGDGIGTKKFPSIYLCREKLRTLKDQQFTKEGTKMIEVKMKYIITAWNLYRSGQAVTKLVIDKNAALPQAE